MTSNSSGGITVKSFPSTEKENNDVLLILHGHDTHTHTGQFLAADKLPLIYYHAFTVGRTVQPFFGPLHSVQLPPMIYYL